MIFVNKMETKTQVGIGGDTTSSCEPPEFPEEVLSDRTHESMGRKEENKPECMRLTLFYCVCTVCVKCNSNGWERAVCRSTWTEKTPGAPVDEGWKAGGCRDGDVEADTPSG